MTALFHLSSNLSKIALFKKGIDKKLVLYLGIPAILFVILGGLLTSYFDNKILEICLGIFLILISAIFLIFKKLTIKKGKSQAVIGGTLSGFLAGLLGTGGAVRGLTMAAFNLEKNAFVATSAIIDFGVDFSRTIVYFFKGYINTTALIYLPFLLLIGFIGTYFGKKILNHMSHNIFKTLSLVMILIIGIITIFKVIYE